MAININKLLNCNVYVDGGELLGQVEEFDIPELNFKMVEHKALGLFGSFELPSGLDKLEARCKWNAFYDDVVSTSNPYKAIQFQVRANLETYGSTGRTGQQSMVFTMTAVPKKLPGFKFKQSDNVEMESTFSITRCKLVVDGQTKFEADVTANKLVIDGEDVLSTFRANS